MQHVYWSRMALQSEIFDQPDKEFIVNRLMQNPNDFEAAFEPFYGEENAAKLADLLSNHLTIADEIVKDTMAGDTAAAADAEKRWYDNADQLATFLADINPYWTVQDWQPMLYDHLDMLKTEAEDMISQNYEDSIDVFGNIEEEALEMADLMTQGIIKQFPQYFR